MKKFIYSLLFMAMAVVSAVAITSCGSSDDDDDPVDVAYSKYKSWLSDDVLALTDVVQEGVNFSYTTPATYSDLNIPGKEGTVEYIGQQVSEAHFNVTVKLKDNWQEILATKDEVLLGFAIANGSTRDSRLDFGTNMRRITITKSIAGTNEKYEELVSGWINTIKMKSIK